MWGTGGIGGSLADEGIPWAGTGGACFICRLGRGGSDLPQLNSGGTANGQPHSLWNGWGDGGRASMGYWFDIPWFGHGGGGYRGVDVLMSTDRSP